MHSADTKHIDALHGAAAHADQALATALMAATKNSAAMLAQIGAGSNGGPAYYLAVSPAFGRFLYRTARERGARNIVEFGTSMGVSTIYLAAALRDNGGGRLIGTECAPAKVQRARANVAAAGFADLVDIRAGDARETLQAPGDDIDLLLLDGEYSLYLPILRLLEPHLKRGAVILAENAADPDYQDYVRNPANGYRSRRAAIGDGRHTEFTTWTGA